ncbi:transposase [Lysinibacillus odysseyi]|nr:transposase [Lysinibacillus odysseyi]
MRHVLHKLNDQLTETVPWYLRWYLSMSKDLKEVYGLKELCKA